MTESPDLNLPKKKTSLLRWLARLALGLAGLLVILVIGAYLFRDQIAAELKQQLDGQMERQGIHLDYSATDFSPFSGITLSDLRVYESSAKEKPVIALSQARLRFDLWDILKDHEKASVRIIAKKARLVLSDTTGDFPFTDLNTTLSVDRTGIQLDRFQGGYRDLNLNASGLIEWAALDQTPPAATANSAAEESDPAKAGLDLSPVLQWLDQVPETPDGQADLTIKFSRTVDQKAFSLEGQLSGKKINWQAFSVSDAKLEFAIATAESGSTRLEFSTLKFGLGEGSLSALGHWDVAEKQLRFDSLKSSLNPALLAPLFPADQAASLPSLPPYQLEAKGSIDLGDPLASDLSGQVTCDTPFSLPIPNAQPLPVSRLSSPFTWKDRMLNLPEFEATAGPGGSLALSADLSVRFAPVSPDGAAKVGPVIEFHPFILKRDGRQLSAKGDLALPDKVLHLASLESNLDLAGTLTDLGLTDFISPQAQFPAPPEITLQGSLPLGSILTSEISGTVKAPEGIRIPAGENRIAELLEFSTGFALKGEQLKLSDLSAKVFNGAIRLNAALNLAAAPGPLPVEGDLTIENLKFESITKFFDAGEERTGLVSGRFVGSGSADIATLNGEGEIRIAEADFGTVPVFRKLKPLLLAITMGNWKDGNQGATVTSGFAIKNGVLHSDDISLKGDFYEINSVTELNFPERTVEASGVVKTNGATGLITGIVGKALEVEATGSFDDFTWKLKNAPGIGTVSDLNNLSGDLLGRTLEAAANGANLPGAVISTMKDTLTNGAPVKDTLKEASDLGKAILGIGFPKKKEKEVTEPAPPVSPPPATEPAAP